MKDSLTFLTGNLVEGILEKNKGRVEINRTNTQVNNHANSQKDSAHKSATHMQINDDPDQIAIASVDIHNAKNDESIASIDFNVPELSDS